jgi:hypothetical protein
LRKAGLEMTLLFLFYDSRLLLSIVTREWFLKCSGVHWIC